MKKGAAIVTGASSGIGLAVSKALCDLGYEVYGIGREFQDRPSSGRFHPLCCDLLDTDRLCALVKEVSSKEQICALINNAGCAYYGLHEELSPKKIQQMVRTNLEVPLILSSLLLRQLKKQGGFIVNISSVTAGASNPHGCAYGATKAGLSSFSRSLFDEARKYGVKVVAVSPDMTKTGLYRNAGFTVGDEEASYLEPKEVARAVAFALSQREGAVVTELTLRPQIHRIKRKTGKKEAF